MGIQSANRDPITTSQISSAGDFHPKFNDWRADIILSSKEGTLFRVHSIVLQSASGLLQLFLSDINRTKQEPAESTIESNSGNPRNDPPTEVITLPFSDPPIERVLLVMTAQEIPPWSSWSELEAAVDVMEYLDTPGLLSFVRTWCLNPVFLSEPIRVYGLGAKFEWEEVMQHAAKLSLRMNLFPSPRTQSPNTATSEEENSDQLLEEPDIENQLSRLIHRHRRDEFRTFIRSPNNFNAAASAQYTCGCNMANDNTPWLLLSSRLVWEMDQNPSGSAILSADMDSWEEATRCWNSRCKRCGGIAHERVEMLRKLRKCIEGLPTHV
ncbi:hypothetical protein AN958_11178 [Leucoagaricus sp. SymC.cos]|nr:hypothetical protein AN958_11178 [Leucoagaricus sp. SymC.cos]